jgi:hypothetical protein
VGSLPTAVSAALLMTVLGDSSRSIGQSAWNPSFLTALKEINACLASASVLIRRPCLSHVISGTLIRFVAVLWVVDSSTSCSISFRTILSTRDIFPCRWAFSQMPAQTVYSHVQSGCREVYRFEVGVRLTGPMVDNLDLYCPTIIVHCTSRQGRILREGHSSKE